MNDLVEKPDPGQAPSNIAILGRYIITPEIFPILAETEPGKGGEIQLTDALKTLSLAQAMYAYKFQGKRFDVGSKLGYLEATVEFALNRPGLASPFREYLRRVVEREKVHGVQECAAAKE